MPKQLGEFSSDSVSASDGATSFERRFQKLNWTKFTALFSIFNEIQVIPTEESLVFTKHTGAGSSWPLPAFWSFLKKVENTQKIKNI